MTTSFVPIVDEHDKLIEYKARGTLNQSDIYRVAALWITNTHGQVLVAKRALTKTQSPGKWGPAVAGTVEKGETYYNNIVKEAQEELGLADVKPIKDVKLRVSQEHNFFCQWYTLTIDMPISQFVLKADEVSQVRWMSLPTLKDDIRAHPTAYTSGFKEWMKLFA